MAEEQAKFEGFAVVEMMGHQREIGYVTTEYFGGAALFRVDVPELPEREYELERPEWINGSMVPKGSKVKREAVPGRSRFVAPSALYAMNPCTEEAARKALERQTERSVMVVSLNTAALPEPSDEQEYEEEEEG